MSRRTQEAVEQHLLLVVESAQRAGLSEDEIGEIVAEAVEDDVERERAA
jgi:DNA-binding transcriptional regulator YhcF (GntR family)